MFFWTFHVFWILFQNAGGHSCFRIFDGHTEPHNHGLDRGEGEGGTGYLWTAHPSNSAHKDLKRLLITTRTIDVKEVGTNPPFQVTGVLHNLLFQQLCGTVTELERLAVETWRKRGPTRYESAGPPPSSHPSWLLRHMHVYQQHL